MSYYTMAFVGMAPFGSLLAGTLAHIFGAPHTVVFTGTCCLLGCLWFTLERPKMGEVLRPIWTEMGLLSPAKPPEPVVEVEPSQS